MHRPQVVGTAASGSGRVRHHGQRPVPRIQVPWLAVGCGAAIWGAIARVGWWSPG